jgi:mannose-1-phosphate guanylyltransferase / phosphomannomutase
MNIHGLIIAGGKGTRMRPLTDPHQARFALPKHLLTVCGLPLCESGLNVLNRAGIKDNSVRVHHLYERIQSYFGKRLQCFDGEYGPGGDVVSFADQRDLKADDILVVLSGEYAHNFDLKNMLERVKDAVINGATVEVTQKSVEPEDQFRKIESIVALQDLKRAGCYIFSGSTLSKLTGFTKCGLSNDLLGEILRRKLPLYSAALPDSQYAFEADTLLQLWQANMDAVSGKTGIDCKKNDNRKSYSGVGIFPPVWIGKGVKIGNGSIVGPYTVIGPGYTIGNYAKVTGSVLFSTAGLCGEKEIGNISDNTSILMSMVASSRIPANKRIEFQLAYSDPKEIFTLSPLEFDKEFCYKRIAEKSLKS